MYCTHCGAENPQEAKFCSKCGNEIINEYNDLNIKPAHVTATPANKSNQLTVAVIIAAVFIAVSAAAIIISAFILHAGKAHKDDETHTEYITEAPATPSPASTEYAGSQNYKPASEYSYAEPVRDTYRINKKNEFLQRAEAIEAYAAPLREIPMSQSDMNREAGIIFEKWDQLLNDVYQYLKSIMDSESFSTLRREEQNWIKEKEAAMDAAEAEVAGGSMAPLVRCSTGTEYTRDRCYYLISYID